MSFFLGSDNNDKKIMHITKGQHDINIMKGDVFDKTIFHSDLKYLTWTERNDFSYSGGYFYPEQSLINDINSNNIAWFIVSGNTIVNLSGYYFLVMHNGFEKSFSWNNAWWNGKAFNNEWQTSYAKLRANPTDGCNRLKFSASGEVKVYTLNLDASSLIYPIKTSDGIQVGGGKMIVNGINMFDYNYISAGKVNNSDGYFSSSGNTYQFVNQSAVQSDNMSILSKFGSTKIIRGNTVMFDSNIIGALNYKSSSKVFLSNYGDGTSVFSAFPSELNMSYSFFYIFVRPVHGYDSQDREICSGGGFYSTSKKRVTMLKYNYNYTDMFDYIYFDITDSGVKFTRTHSKRSIFTGQKFPEYYYTIHYFSA